MLMYIKQEFVSKILKNYQNHTQSCSLGELSHEQYEHAKDL